MKSSSYFLLSSGGQNVGECEGHVCYATPATTAYV